MNRANLVPLVLLTAIAASVASQSHAGVLTFNYTSFTYPSAVNTNPNGISGSNIVGQYQDSSGNLYGFFYNGSTFTKLADPLAKVGGSFGTDAQGMSGNNIVGWYPDKSGFFDGFIYNTSTKAYTTIDNPLGLNTEALGIDGNNIVGTYYNSTGNHSFFFNGTTYTTIDDPLAGPQGTYAYGISGNNIVGYYDDVGGKPHGFLYNGSTYTTLDDPLANNGTYAYGISGNNIVGVYDNTSMYEGYHGFIFSGTTYTTLDYPGVADDTIANGISGNDIVGYYPGPVGADPLYGQGFLLVVPEPSSIVLFGFAAICLAVVACRRMRKQAA